MTLTLEKPVPAPMLQHPPEFHWTVDSYYKAYDAGAFGYDKRLELIHGRIMEKMPQGPRHSWLITSIAQMLRQAAISGSIVREEKPIHIAFDGEPEPYIALVRGGHSDYQNEHPLPEETLLIVEAASTSTEYDLAGKALLYAQAGIEDYWVALVNENVVVVHREPSAEGYQSVTKLSGTDRISPLAAPAAMWTVEALLGVEEKP